MQSMGLTLARTKVGDRYVMEEMRGSGFNVGGEPSGHIIMSDYVTTGDALIAALQILAMKLEDGRPMSEAAHMFDPVPQILKNVRYKGANPMDSKAVQDAIADAQNQLGNAGRVFVRPSGTEPLLRIMIEGDDDTTINRLADGIAQVVESQKAAA